MISSVVAGCGTMSQRQLGNGGTEPWVPKCGGRGVRSRSLKVAHQLRLIALPHELVGAGRVCSGPSVWQGDPYCLYLVIRVDTTVQRNPMNPTGNSHRTAVSRYRNWEVCSGIIHGLMELRLIRSAPAPMEPYGNPHRPPSHNSKTVLSIVKIGPPNWTKSRTFVLKFDLDL